MEDPVSQPLVIQFLLLVVLTLLNAFFSQWNGLSFSQSFSGGTKAADGDKNTLVCCGF